MIALPKFLFFFLCRIPVVGGALKRSPDEVEETESSIRFPIFWLFDAVFRSIFCLALVGALVWAVVANLPDSSVQPVELTAAVYLSDEEFDKLLAGYDREQLIQLLQIPVEDLQISDPQRRQGLVNQILAANKLARSPMRSRKVHGISRELELRTLLALADLENNRFDAQHNAELTELSKLYEGIVFPERDEQTEALKQRAGIGQVVSNFIASVEDPHEESAVTKEAVALEKLQQLGQQSVISQESYATLSTLVELSRKRIQQIKKPSDCCENLDQLLAEVQLANRERATEDFAKIDCSLASASVLDYLAEKELIKKDRFLRDFESKFRQLVLCGELGEAEFTMMLDKLDGLIRGGWTHASRRILVEVVGLMNDAGEFPALTERSVRMARMLERVGKRLNDADLKTVANLPAAFEENNALAKFVVYLSVIEEERSQESIARLREMARVYNTLVTTTNIKFHGIIVHNDQQTQAEAESKSYSEEYKPIEFWHLDTNSVGGSELLETVPFEKLPHVLILDKLNRLVSIDPRNTQTIEIVGKLRMMDR